MRHFLAEYNRAATNPTTGLLRPMSLSSCKTCVGLEDDIQGLLDDQERFAVAPLRVDDVTCVACGPEQGVEWYVHAFVQQQKVAILDGLGRPKRGIKQVSDVMQFAVRWNTSGWSVGEIKLAR